MEPHVKEREQAGVWIRCATFGIDILVIYGATHGVVTLGRLFAMYIPLELTATVLTLCYSVLFIRWNGQTIGKLIGGLTVQRSDSLARTVIYRDTQARHRAPMILGLVFGFGLLRIGMTAVESLSYYTLYRKMAPYRQAKTPFDSRAPSSVTEVALFNPNDDSVFVQWLDKHSKNPVDYAIDVASRHQVTIFGESHMNRGQLLFLHELIPVLYHRAGVRVLAMEVCTHEDNEKIQRLITASRYDRDMALRIGRNQPWRSWGAREYWDVFEIVWRLNQSLPPGQPGMRVVGLDHQWDGPSFALAMGGDDAVKGPPWEKLRILRALLSLPGLALRDELMAHEVEEEIITKEEHGIVWVGRHHAFIRYKQPYGQGRMAYMLHQKYGDTIGQVTLHAGDFSPRLITPDYKGPPPRISSVLERIMAARGHAPVGFDVTGSPFALLRDSTSYYYRGQPRVGFGDVTSGYIYLEPRNTFQSCQWAEGFITPDMFAQYRPFYEGKLNTTLRNAEEVNESFIKELRKEH